VVAVVAVVVVVIVAGALKGGQRSPGGQLLVPRRRMAVLCPCTRVRQAACMGCLRVHGPADHLPAARNVTARYVPR